MNGKEILKSPKREITDDDEQQHQHQQQQQQQQKNPENSENGDQLESIRGRDDYEEQQEALIALYEHRSKEVDHLRNRVNYYTNELKEAEERLDDTERKLARVRNKLCDKKWNQFLPGYKPGCIVVNGSSSPAPTTEGSSQRQSQFKPPLIISNVSQRPSRPASMTETARRVSPNHSNSPMNPLVPSRPTSMTETARRVSPNHSNSPMNPLLPSRPTSMTETAKRVSPNQSNSPMNPLLPSWPTSMTETARRVSPSHSNRSMNSRQPSQATRNPETGRRVSPSHSNSPLKSRLQATPLPEDSKTQVAGKKRKLEFREHKELIPMVRSSSSPSLIQCHANVHVSSLHTRKLRSLTLCPVNEKLFVTSALDGVVNLWQLQPRGSGATRLRSMDCPSSKQRRWPEDIAWHPEGNKLFAVYTADGRDNQISMIDLNKKQSYDCVTYLEGRPHVKGIINSISFMPWEETCFMTGGSDHAVVFWNEKGSEEVWQPKALHRNIHSSAVMGVAGLRHKQIVLSAGADRRIIGYDVLAGRVDYRYQIESKCMSVLPNPCDFNLFMVQTGTPERQLRLFDIRLRQSELHSIGWRQESSESQSALINQAWSPDGFYISSGSADPMIHIFDIRYNSKKPSQSVRAHQKRVFKAEWHSTIPLLISISSDLNIGLHKF